MVPDEDQEINNQESEKETGKSIFLPFLLIPHYLVLKGACLKQKSKQSWNRKYWKKQSCPPAPALSPRKGVSLWSALTWEETELSTVWRTEFYFIFNIKWNLLNLKRIVSHPNNITDKLHYFPKLSSAYREWRLKHN